MSFSHIWIAIIDV